MVRRLKANAATKVLIALAVLLLPAQYSALAAALQSPTTVQESIRTVSAGDNQQHPDTRGPEESRQVDHLYLPVRIVSDRQPASSSVDAEQAQTKTASKTRQTRGSVYDLYSWKEWTASPPQGLLTSRVNIPVGGVITQSTTWTLANSCQ